MLEIDLKLLLIWANILRKQSSRKVFVKAAYDEFILSETFVIKLIFHLILYRLQLWKVLFDDDLSLFKILNVKNVFWRWFRGNFTPEF